MKITKTHIVKNNETGEFQVRAYDANRNRLPNCDYFTDCKNDATATARAMVENVASVDCAAMSRADAKNRARFCVDDSGAAREIGADVHAIIRESGERFNYASVLVGFESPRAGLVFVAVHSYLDVELSDSECALYAVDYLAEIGIVAHDCEPSIIIR